LTEARVLQLYNQKKMNCILPYNQQKKVDLYPFVFDSMIKITQTSAYIAGSKILLPENIKRTDSRDLEEIEIPATSSFTTANPEHFVGTKEEICFRPFKKINELDDIGQIAFRNTKSLNRIQSIVFDAAYNSNENLLICN
jgi:activating signal cointegrator complex subunit 3